MTSYDYSRFIIVLGALGFFVQVIQYTFDKSQKWYKKITPYGWVVSSITLLMILGGILGLNKTEKEKTDLNVFSQHQIDSLIGTIINTHSLDSIRFDGIATDLIKYNLMLKDYKVVPSNITFTNSQFNYSKGSHVVNGTNNGINGDINQFSEKYALMAQLNIDGLPFTAGQGLTVSSDLSNLMGRVVTRNDKMYQVIMSKETFKYVDEVIDKYPYFPFAYWAKSALLSYYGDTAWVEYAEKAVTILNQTTQIEGHVGTHDDVLKSINNSLMQYYQSKR